MPQGKGTYGSKVGRPSKKYQSGGNVDPFSTRNPEGVPAEQMAESMENQNMASAGLPTANAMERSENYQLGGAVRPPTSPSIIPPPQYKEGGTVKKDAPHLKSDNPEIQKMYDEGRKRYVKKQNKFSKWDKNRPIEKKPKGAFDPSEKGKKSKKKLQTKKKRKWEGQA
tara:strand:- start:54 stop:557 length:504 start_codon:yes stop_codon:yes gene_type:complete